MKGHQHMGVTPSPVILFDVDNTLLDNDQVERDLRGYLTERFGTASAERYWAIFEERRAELGYADYLGTLQRYRVEHLRSPHVLETSLYLLDYPFETRLYPGALNVVATLAQEAQVVILSDGDVVFQPHKVQRSGLWNAFDGHVLIYIHKELMLDDVAERYPASHYVMIDDKPRILAAMKARWGPRLTTVFVRQGHYATAPAADHDYPAADLTIDQIADLTRHDVATLARVGSVASIVRGG